MYDPKPKTIPYVPKPKVEKPMMGYAYASPKPMLEKPKTIPYVPKRELEEPKIGYAPKSKLEKPKIIPLVPKPELKKPTTYTRLSSFFHYVVGALARITCQAVNKNGYESAPFSVLSHPINSEGYFSTTVSPYELEDAWKLTECKVLLEKSPLETCKVPADVNKGISGAPLSSFRLLKDENIKLYSVGPFFYTSEPKPVF
ncbi:hypothetical protein CsSME_00039901 [Camellia sinensis var. sinensis]